MAVAHTIVVIVSHGLLEGTVSDESRDDRQDTREEERSKQRALAARERPRSKDGIHPRSYEHGFLTWFDRIKEIAA
jgi:hypothetical protein